MLKIARPRPSCSNFSAQPAATSSTWHARMRVAGVDIDGLFIERLRIILLQRQPSEQRQRDEQVNRLVRLNKRADRETHDAEERTKRSADPDRPGNAGRPLVPQLLDSGAAGERTGRQ